ncbi:MAG: hypothetical protein ACI9TI_002274, partial [Natronomonas sp.]
MDRLAPVSAGWEQQIGYNSLANRVYTYHLLFINSSRVICTQAEPGYGSRAFASVIAHGSRAFAVRV